MITEKLRLYPHAGKVDTATVTSFLTSLRFGGANCQAVKDRLKEIPLIAMVPIIAQAASEGIKSEVLHDLCRNIELEFMGDELKFTEPVRSGPVKSQSMDINMSDVIRLAAKNTGNTVLERFGEWWKVTGAANAGACWILTSVADQPKTLPKKEIGIIKLLKSGSEEYEVLSVVKFPEQFSYKKHGKKQ